METLTRHPEPAAAPSAEAQAPLLAEAPARAVPEAAPEAAARACAACAAPMAGGQDWCLECGTAAPGRLGRRPGWRAVGATLSLTLLLLGGAGAASYAALSSDATRAAGTPAPADATPVAQAPPEVPGIAAPVIIPRVKAPAPAKVATPKALPVAPAVSTPAPAPVATTPAPETTPSTSTSTKDTTTTPSSSQPDADQTRDDALTPLGLDADAVSVFDPAGRATPTGDPAAAYDDDASTSFTLGAPADGADLQFGVVVDLGARKEVGGLKLTSSTPGAGLEVYATDSPDLPTDVTDPRWDEPISTTALKRTQELAFTGGAAKYRWVVVWFTKPPASGRAVTLEELALLH